jgi:HPr kinase/phosphorylase
LAAAHDRIHATCVALSGKAVVLRGPSGSGKSDLALRLMHLAGPGLEPARLVADDQVILETEGATVIAKAPANLFGRLEVRGLGIITVDALASSPVALVADLVASGEVERMPAPGEITTVCGISLPRMALCAFEASAPLKIALALRGLCH